jgi:ribonuclease R
VLVLRALKQAYYSPRNLGHAGLGSARYCHFTSPIRRYPDVVAHRALLQGLGIDEVATPAHELEDAGVISSAAERDAMKIERDADDVCLSFLLERVLAGADRNEPPSFEGEVVGLIEKGAFVQFGAERFEGLLPVRRLRGWWTLNELGTALEAEGSGRRLRLGDSIQIEVDGVDAPRGRVDLSAYSLRDG